MRLSGGFGALSESWSRQEAREAERRRGEGPSGMGITWLLSISCIRLRNNHNLQNSYPLPSLFYLPSHCTVLARNSETTPETCAKRGAAPKQSRVSGVIHQIAGGSSCSDKLVSHKTKARERDTVCVDVCVWVGGQSSIKKLVEVYDNKVRFKSPLDLQMRLRSGDHPLAAGGWRLG